MTCKLVTSRQLFTILHEINIPGIAPGIYHGSLNFDASNDFIDGAQLLPYPALTTSSSPAAVSPDVPISISLTEFHFILLYRDRVLGICNLDDRTTYEEALPLVGLYISH